MFPTGRSDTVLRLFAVGTSAGTDNHAPWRLTLARNMAGKARRIWDVPLVKRGDGARIPTGTLARFLASRWNLSYTNGFEVPESAPKEARDLVGKAVAGYACYERNVMGDLVSYVVTRDGAWTAVGVRSADAAEAGYPITQAERDLMARPAAGRGSRSRCVPEKGRAGR